MNKLATRIICGSMLVSALLTMSVFVSPVNAAENGHCVCPGETAPTVIACDTGNPTVACNNLSCNGKPVNGTCSADSGTPTPTPTSGNPAAGKLDNPLSGVCSATLPGQQCVQLIIGNVIKAALGIVGSIALLIMTYGGFRWLTAMGNSERVEKGKETLIWAALGLAVIFGAYAITSYVITKLTTK